MKKLARVTTTMFIIGVCSLAATVYTTGLPVAGATEPSTTRIIKRAGISIAVPDAWIVYDPTRQETKAAFDAAVAGNPDLKQFSSAATSAAQHSVLEAVRPASDVGTQAALSIQFYDGIAVKEPVSLVKAELERSGAFRSVDVRRARFAGADAVQVRATIPLDSGGLTGVHELMYEFVSRKGLVLIGCFWKVGTPKPADVNAVLRSVRLAR
jgi:hypothetical protein